MAEFELTKKVLVKNLAGCGVQFNQHVFAAITGLPEERFHDLETKVVALAPQFVRIFYNDKQHGDPSDPNQTSAQKNKWGSFVRAVKLAQLAGATINITWQSGKLLTSQDRDRSMTRFANVLDALVTTSHVTNLRWVTIQNEPNSPVPKGHVKEVTPERLGACYRTLDRLLTKRGLRKQIRFMGGDLIEGSSDPKSSLHHKKWFEHMSRSLAGILDGYSAHAYWNYDDVARFHDRLEDTRRIVDGLTNPKPLFMTEYGVRGKNRRPNTADDPGDFQSGAVKTPLRKTNVAAFQHAWFQIRAAQLGYAGTIKWDCFFGRYDRGKQAYYAIGAPGPGPQGWKLYPMYYLLRLFTMTTEAGWRVLAIKSNVANSKKHLAAFAGKGSELTIVGLDERGALLNGRSAEGVSYSIGGLPVGASFTLVLWNRAGGGKLVSADPVTADATGTATVTAPLQSVFALTTKTVSLP